MAKNEDFWSQSLGGNDTSNDMPMIGAHFLSGFFRGFLKLWRLEVKNVESLRSFEGKDSGAVIVAPHVSYMDPIIMFVAARPKQWIRFIGKDSLWENYAGILGKIISRAGAFPIKRDTADRTAIKLATRMLKNGENVGIFPEGTRRGKGDKNPSLHGGAVLIARMGKAPIIPLGIHNVDLIKEKGKMLKFPKVTATFGDPIALSSFDFLPKNERLDGCAWYVMRESFALMRQCEPEEVDMTELFPESKDYSEIFREHVIEPLDVSTLPTYEEVQAKKKLKGKE